MRKKRILLLPALLACTLLIAPIGARAVTNLGLNLQSTPDNFTLCDDNGDFAGCVHNKPDSNPAAGVITYIGGVGGWTTNVTTGLGPPMLHLPELLDLNNVTLNTGGAGPLTMILTVTGLTDGLGKTLNFVEGIGGTNSFAGSTLSIQSWLSNTNVAFCVTTACGMKLTDQTVSGGVFSSKTSGFGTIGSGPEYSITLQITLDSGGHADTTSFDSFLSIPEPATLSVLGAGLLAFGTGLRKRLLRA
jgi:hypothetical protein